LHNSTNRVVLGVDVKETLNSNLAASGVLADRADVVNPDTCAVVALVGQAVNDVQVVIDTLAVCGVERSSPLGRLEISEVNNVGDRVARSSRAIAFLFTKGNGTISMGSL
jgi:hypothetical protein